MSIHIEHNGTVFEYEYRPMPEGRFRVLCSLALAAIIGAVLVALVHMAGIWPIVWAVGTLALAGVYKVIQSI